MKALLAQTGAVRLFTWMRPWGHPMPKPTVIYSNVCYEILEFLKRKWSKKIAERIRREALGANRKLKWLKKINGHNFTIHTAAGFWKARKKVIQNMIYVVRKWNASKNKMEVTGTKLLAASAAYTRSFSRAALHTFASAAKEKTFTGANSPYVEIWKAISFEKTTPYTPYVRDLEKDRLHALKCSSTFKTSTLYANQS